jgi:hypothetical protein
MFETFFVCKRVEVVWFTKSKKKYMSSFNVPLDTIVAFGILKKVSKADAKIINKSLWHPTF